MVGAVSTEYLAKGSPSEIFLALPKGNFLSGTFASSNSKNIVNFFFFLAMKVWTFVREESLSLPNECIYYYNVFSLLVTSYILINLYEEGNAYELGNSTVRRKKRIFPLSSFLTLFLRGCLTDEFRIYYNHSISRSWYLLWRSYMTSPSQQIGLL